MLKREVIEVVGFDLDECLYPSNPAINDRIRNRMAEAILDKIPALGSLKSARHYFESRYQALQSGRKILIESGFSKEEAGRLVDEAVSQADIFDLLIEDQKTADIVRRISEKYKTSFLLTSSPEEGAKRKLRAIGIDSEIFGLRGYSDTPRIGHKPDGTAFQYILSLTRLPPENHVYIGNSRKSDILPAKALGMQTIGVWSHIPEADLSIGHIHELEGVLL